MLLTFHGSFVIPVLHRATIRCGFLLGASREDTRESGEEIEVQACLYIWGSRIRILPHSMATKSGKHTLALAFVVSSRLSTMPERVGAASWPAFFETVEDDMIVR
jgi:hypothetical protein